MTTAQEQAFAHGVLRKLAAGYESRIAEVPSGGAFLLLDDACVVPPLHLTAKGSRDAVAAWLRKAAQSNVPPVAGWLRGAAADLSEPAPEGFVLAVVVSVEHALVMVHPVAAYLAPASAHLQTKGGDA